ncbi:Cytochrome b561 [Loktanella fryxellensis]|uniref:Cytochrome b561 n=1 Tax=Loktanella fryxellensis TaxID=245187 RepID=A0A1H8K1Z1_9RHOB|nr:cytochrome b [Loktanella fryxellensis]SEN87029.1 Cytochrome b561 [Loktanella fryxellensis]
MTEFYIILAVCLAIFLNQSSRIGRAIGTLTAALALVMIAYSILIANFDGTFAAIPTDAELGDRIKPFVLNAQAGVASLAALFLLWATYRQGKRHVTDPLPLRNTDTHFGRVSRYAHWIIGVLILILVPMGLFVSILAPDHPARPAFLATHQMLGLTVLLLVACRMLWLLQSPAPLMRADIQPLQRKLAKATHLALYGIMLGFPVTGVLLTVWDGNPLEVFGWSLSDRFTPNSQLAESAAILHNLVLPAVFYLAVAAHLGAVTVHHFAERRLLDVRRMLR